MGSRITRILLLLAPLLTGGSWHQYERLNCSDCHTMHNSAGGVPMRYDGDQEPALHLLRAATPDTLCLQCHGRPAAAGAPGVLQLQGDTPTFDTAGGFFTLSVQGGLPITGLGHAVGVAPLDDPATYFSTQPRTLGCLSCHDQHGNGVYRNLRPGPSGRGGAASPLVTERVLAGTGPLATVYSAANVSARSGFTQWCQDCHDQPGHYHVDVTFENRPDLYSSYASNALSAAGQPLPRARVQTPVIDAIPDPTNQITCLSCHKAHGGAAPHGVVYPDPTDTSSLCARCHVPPVATAP